MIFYYSIKSCFRSKGYFLFWGFFLCLALTLKAKEQYSLEISSVIPFQEQGKYSWKISGKSTYPKGTLFQITFTKNSPVATKTIQGNNFAVTEGDWEFVLESFDKKIAPGKYCITVFFSPQFQEHKIESGFQKARYDFFWQQDKYSSVFETQRKEIKALYSQIQELYQIMLRDCESSKKMQMLSIWQAGSSIRSKRLQNLREKIDKYCMEYMEPFFHFPYWYIHGLIYFLEDIEEETEAYLQKKESRILEFREKFCRRMQEANFSFVYESLALTDNLSSLIEEEFLALYEVLKNKRVSFPVEKSISELRILAMYLQKIKEIRQKFISSGSFDHAPDFFWEVCQQIQGIEAENLSFEARNFFYELVQSILKAWMKSFKPDAKGFLPLPQEDFDSLWKMTTSEYNKKALFIKVLLLDLKDMQEKALILKECLPEKTQEDYEEIWKDWSAQTIKIQQCNRYLLSFSQDNQISSFFHEYDRLCLSWIHLCYLVSISEESIEKKILSFLKEIEKLKSRIQN